ARTRALRPPLPQRSANFPELENGANGDLTHPPRGKPPLGWIAPEPSLVATAAGPLLRPHNREVEIRRTQARFKTHPERNQLLHCPAGTEVAQVHDVLPAEGLEQRGDLAAGISIIGGNEDAVRVPKGARVHHQVGADAVEGLD